MFYFRYPKKRVAGNLDYRLDLDSSGKWVIFGKRDYIGKLWKISREYVKIGEFYEVKFTWYKKGKYALLVYADKHTKKDFYKKLEDLNLNPKWVSNDYTKKVAKRKRKIKRLINKIL